jgi:hypothetical protein
VVKRWWLILTGLMIGAAALGQNDPPRLRPIPRQNYREVHSAPNPITGPIQWQKGGLFNPQLFHQWRQSPQQQLSRAPVWDRDLTNVPTDELHPVYVSRASRMYFASNATRVENGRLANPGPFYRIWRGDLDDGRDIARAELTNFVQITGDTPDEQFSSQIQPSVTQNESILAYASRSASGNYNIIIRNLFTRQRIVLTIDNDGRTQNLRPSLNPGGNLVVFASNRLELGETEADRRFRLYMARTDGRPFDDGRFFRRLTFPAADEEDIEPAWSPDGQRIAFVRARRGANGYAYSYIYMLEANNPNLVVPWTVFVDNNNNRPLDRQPAWGADRGGSPLLLFASTRKSLDNQGRHRRGTAATAVDVTNRIYDIYRISATISEELGAVALSVTADPSTPALAQPNYPGDPERIAGAQYPTDAIQVRNRVAYHSTRLNEAQNQGPHDLWETLVYDLTPPVMEILPVVHPKELFPEEEVRIRVRVVDFQSGVESVLVQFKDPDSAEQDAEGLEHKIYLLFITPQMRVDNNIGLPIFVEIGQQAIHPETYAYVDPYILAFMGLGFDGRREDALAMRFVPEDPNNPDPTQSGWWEVTWRTPGVPSDFYIDVIVRDYAGNEFVYDNISGFTTQRFTGENRILLVSDYAAGQMFVQTRSGPLGGPFTIGRPTWQPVESYWTDNPTGKAPYDRTFDPAGLFVFGDGAIPSPNAPSPIFRTRADTLGGNTPSNFAAYRPDGELIVRLYDDKYNIWRVQCRNPITSTVLAGYLPRNEVEPTDLRGGTRTKLHAERAVFWASPYTGNVWAGPGHLLDPEVQTVLQSYLAAAGRLLVSGQDVAWALTLSGSTANVFLQQSLQASFDTDTAPDVFLPIGYARMRHVLTATGAGEDELNIDPDTGDPNPIAYNPGGMPLWPRADDVPDWLVLIVESGFRSSPFELWLADPANMPTDGGDPVRISPELIARYSDAAWNQIWIDTVTTTPPRRAPYRYTTPGANAHAQQRAGTYYANPTNKSKMVYFAFGLEGVDSGYEQVTIAGITLMWCNAYRNKVLHNALSWMTHSIMRGRVLEYDPETRTYRPLPRVLVRLTGILPVSVRAVEVGYAITDSAGEYTIFGIEPGLYLVDAVRPGYRVQHPESVILVSQERRVNLIMLKTPPGQISGRVIDINNQPVRYAVVRATNVEDPELRLEVLSDTDGTFLMPRVPTGTWNVTVVDLALGGYRLPPVRPQPDGVFRDVRVQSGQTTQLPEDFVLEPLPGIIRGRVTRADNGQPIQGARVAAVANNVERGFALTDANGNYSFQVPGGEYQVTATAPGFAPSTQAVSVPREGEVEVNFQLVKLPPGRVTGRVVRKFGGAPEPGATIQLLFGGSPIYTTTTGADGTYTLDSVEPGDYEVRPIKTGFTFEPPSRTITVQPNQTTTVPDFRSEPLRTFFRGPVSLVSAPFDYAQDVADLLGVPPDQRRAPHFRFFTWDTVNSRYIFYPDAPAHRFALGRGYFIQTAQDLALAIEGTPADETRNFEIPLRRGWNLIGTPFRFDIDWEQTQVIDPDTNAPVSNATAVGKQIIANALWGYAFGSYNATRRMKKWEGYWVYAYKDTTLIIPPTARARSASNRSVASPAPSGWMLTLQVQSGELMDQAYIGVSRSASAGYDTAHDLLKPPPVGRDYVYISLPRLNWGAQNGYYGVDVQAPSRSASWEFTVETTQPAREITLRWPNIHQLPRSVNPVLIDLQTGARRYLRTTGSYTFRSPQGGVSRFRIEMASSAGLLRIANVQVSGGRGNQRTITFTLTGEAHVEVNVLAGGKRVRQLLTGAGRSAGVQQVSWDGRDQQGITLPPGTYTVEIRAVSEDGQVARAATTILLTR